MEPCIRRKTRPRLPGTGIRRPPVPVRRQYQGHQVIGGTPGDIIIGSNRALWHRAEALGHQDHGADQERPSHQDSSGEAAHQTPPTPHIEEIIEGELGRAQSPRDVQADTPHVMDIDGYQTEYAAYVQDILGEEQQGTPTQPEATIPVDGHHSDGRRKRRRTGRKRNGGARKKSPRRGRHCDDPASSQRTASGAV
ncbi:uncharacterized protein LOC125224697 [Leguminivora glycinivorella]|uniref:uncharacterized protein LOC125224697 n=1 Tax=Leguminivora glycinivorella TaxID=1035111 RepID=UPI002010BE8A|nr:uncharacterized protein LOC125224697 [Leguminivora glycinivorella]